MTAAPERIEGRFEGVLADGIEHDRYHSAIRYHPHLGDDILAPIDDRVIAAVLAGQGGLRVGQDRAKHVGARDGRALRTANVGERD